MNQVDKLAKIRSQMEDLKKEEKKIVDFFKSQGAGAYGGTDHYAVVSVSEKKTLDMKAVRKKLSRQFIQANTNVSEVTQLRLMGYSKQEVA